MSKKSLERFQKIDHLIQRRSTGTAVELGRRIEVSDRTVKDPIATMREFGAPIYFNRSLNSYCYRNAGKFLIYFST